MTNGVCSICGEEIEGERELITHYRDVHNVDEDDIGVRYQMSNTFCQICGDSFDLTIREFIDHLQEEHGLEESDISIAIRDNEISESENDVPVVVRENFDRIMSYVEDITNQYDKRTNKKLWMRAGLIGVVVAGVFTLAWYGILAQDTITSLISVIVGYLLAREAI